MQVDLLGPAGSGSFGTQVAALLNGNYVVASPDWHNGALTSAGAVTWCSGTSGCTGLVMSGNSLVGSHAHELLGNGSITALTNGNYVVDSLAWNNGGTLMAGAVTWCSGTAGCTGAVTTSNSW